MDFLSLELLFVIVSDRLTIRPFVGVMRSSAGCSSALLFVRLRLPHAYLPVAAAELLTTVLLFARIAEGTALRVSVLQKALAMSFLLLASAFRMHRLNRIIIVTVKTEGMIMPREALYQKIAFCQNIS